MAGNMSFVVLRPKGFSVPCFVKGKDPTIVWNKWNKRSQRHLQMLFQLVGKNVFD